MLMAVFVVIFDGWYREREVAGSRTGLAYNRVVSRLLSSRTSVERHTSKQHVAVNCTCNIHHADFLYMCAINLRSAKRDV